MRNNTIQISAVSLGVMLGVFLASLAYGSEFKRTILQVEQMRCSSCLRVIDAELRKVPGILGMTAKFSDAQISVDHRAEVSAQEIATIITKLGYPATIVSGTGISEHDAQLFQRSGFGSGTGCCNPGGASPVAESWKELRRRIFRQRSGRGQLDGVRP